MKRSDFYFELPPRLIAQHPAAERSGSRMLLLDRNTGSIQHRRFSEIASFFAPGDCLVINDSKVIPARLLGESSRGSAVELLLHERLDERRWEVLVKPGKKARAGEKISFAKGKLTASIESVTDDGLRVAAFEYEGIFETLLDEIGETPLPHYITEHPATASERARYQTVYARYDGSVAAPTAGLHFTEEILRELSGAGVRIARVTLHVGLGTFRPVKADNIDDHRMHSEYCRVEPDQAEIINEARKNNRRVIAVGTTSCRTLESSADEAGIVVAGSRRTGIFIKPGYTFRVVDGLLTNFHLPESTLIMLVSALAGRERVLSAYRQAIKEEYRFYSYGDCMLIL
ncbi:MAG: tRNA preQ1(34) S-adenosylmethionine ribosyltransferase-isomerase QueA [Clostridiales bacterium]|nr:tRNA preQ1(34) S-adenosylmethionine ribosyltransferase-isomerase QueA [Clostridiales bacterium]